MASSCIVELERNRDIQRMPVGQNAPLLGDRLKLTLDVAGDSASATLRTLPDRNLTNGRNILRSH
jgi:hypothetical protein